MKDFATQLKELRLNRNLLLRQVAAAIDVDTSMISKFESGERFPTKEQIEKLAFFFKVPKENFLIEVLSDKLTYEFIEEPLAMKILNQTIKKLKFKKINK